MQAIGYVRVSTPNQASDGVSLAAQRERIAAWCGANGYTLGEIHVDNGISGGRADNRPALQAALNQAAAAKATVVTYSLSRVARSTTDAIAISERLRKAGADPARISHQVPTAAADTPASQGRTPSGLLDIVSTMPASASVRAALIYGRLRALATEPGEKCGLVSLSEHIDTTTAAGKMVFRMLAVLAEFERDLISERTAIAMRHKRARGEYTGGAAPYGWRIGTDGNTLEPDESERIAIRAACTLRAHGVSLRGIGQRLAAAGRLPRSGKRWHPKTIGDLLRAATRIAEDVK